VIRCKSDFIKSHTRRIEGPAGATKVAAGLIFFVRSSSVQERLGSLQVIPASAKIGNKQTTTGAQYFDEV